MDLNSDISKVKGVGASNLTKLNRLKIYTIHDLLHHYPRRYEDYSHITPVNHVRPGLVSLKGNITSIAGRYIRRGLHITEAIFTDNTGSLKLVWFNQPYRTNSINSKNEYYVSGEFDLKSGRLSVINPSVELVGNFNNSTARIVPIYPETKGLTSRQIRSLLINVKPLIDDQTEILPSKLISERKMLSQSQTISKIHFPITSKDIDKAKERLGFNEIFMLSLAGQLNKLDQARGIGKPISFNKDLAVKFVSKLPFKLTDEQRLVIWRIYKNIDSKIPMNRLVEGDVGSGKTVVAVMSALPAINSNIQVAFMAPTEVLAKQHEISIKRMLKPLGLDKTVLRPTGDLTKPQKTKTQKLIKDGVPKLIIGTHALLQEKVEFKNLSYVIIDEQHRFGVAQRKALQQKAKIMPHVLHLSATPIPRTLALTLYGELSISRLTQKPAGRQPITTKILPFGARPELYRKLNIELKAGRQIFVVCPLIDDSGLVDAKSLTKSFEEIKSSFKNYRVTSLHGKLKSEIKNNIMQDFVNHKIDILVSTTVIEVGVDVPNASVMVIESAERFGLAQIHQLRGRVGRGEHKSYCYLQLDQGQESPSRRLRALESTNDGFRLAELDLELRGPGALYGADQHGELDLKVANLSDIKLVNSARLAVKEFLDQGYNVNDYPELNKKVARLRTSTNYN